MKLWLSVSAAVATMVLPAVLVAAETDGRVKSSIEHDLWDEKIGGVDVTVEGENVTLTGTVHSAWEKRRAGDIALEHDEIRAVENRIEVGIKRTDAEIADEVSQKLRNYVHYSIFDDVNLKVRNGVVTLSGDVTWGYKANEMGKMAMRVPGVRSVENEIETLPSSTNDTQLRAALASRIYGDSAFVRYSTQPTPPVHIIVENSRVTLTGFVDSEVQRRKAGILARETFGVLTVDNQLQLSTTSN